MKGGGTMNSKSKRFTVFCFCFLFGIFINSFLNFKIQLYWIVFICFAFISLYIYLRSNLVAVFLVFCCFYAFLGFARCSFVIPENADNFVGRQNISGFVSSEPDIRSDGVRYIVQAENIGKVYVKYDLYPRYFYGDGLKINCEIVKPEPVEDFRYDMYLANMGVFLICQNPHIEKISKNNGLLFFRKIYEFKNIVAQKVNLLWHEPHASFMAGLLYGYRGGLGELNELFSRTGVTHIVAISGYNISIISSIMNILLINAYVPRKKAFYAVLAGLGSFVVFAGLSASVVRAGIMGIMALTAKQMQRLSNIGNVMLFSAVVMAFHNPYVLAWDAGFQLSFLSTIGLVYLSPKILYFFKNIPEFLGMKETFCSTLSATLATLPLILFQFKRFSIVTLPVNMLILWIIPFIMLVGFLSVIFSFIFMPIAVVISWVGFAGLSYIIFIVKFFAGFSFASVEVQINIYIMLLLYVLIFVITKKRRYVGIK
jgi:competence protein ComEC